MTAAELCLGPINGSDASSLDSAPCDEITATRKKARRRLQELCRRSKALHPWSRAAPTTSLATPLWHPSIDGPERGTFFHSAAVARHIGEARDSSEPGLQTLDNFDDARSGGVLLGESPSSAPPTGIAS